MNRLLTVEEVSEILSLSRGALAQMRYEGRGPVYVKVSAKQILYDEQDLADWVESQKRRGTAE
jgi:predicted DNA-binding transcriptional regulator AlpA